MKIRTGFVSNSSSSCFVCSTKKSLPEITEKLEKLLAFYNETSGREPLEFKQVFKAPKKVDDDDLKYLSGWLEYYNYIIVDKDCTLIYSFDDNSIPYVMFDWIEDWFSGSRLHLG